MNKAWMVKGEGFRVNEEVDYVLLYHYTKHHS